MNMKNIVLDFCFENGLDEKKLPPAPQHFFVGPPDKSIVPTTGSYWAKGYLFFPLQT